MAGRVGTATLGKYFGKLPGQSLADMASEIRALPDSDFFQLVKGIEDGSLTY
jgi:hypothetical protein